MKDNEKKSKKDNSKVVDMDGIPVATSPMYINQKVVNKDSKSNKIDLSKDLQLAIIKHKVKLLLFCLFAIQLGFDQVEIDSVVLGELVVHKKYCLLHY